MKSGAPPSAPEADDDDAKALRQAMRDVAALPPSRQAALEREKPAPVPRQRPAEASPPAPMDTSTPSLLDDYRATTPLKKGQDRFMPAAKPEPFVTKAPPAVDSEFAALLGPLTPMDNGNRVWLDTPRPPPLARQHQIEQERVLQDSLSDYSPWVDEDDNGDELLFLRPGLPRDILRKLRRGEWVTQAEIDFHGCTVDEARERFSAFMQRCLDTGLRCVRMVHGKGLSSPGREPVIKPKLRAWLVQRDDVLAFCPARPFDGGYGAVIVLLRGGRRRSPAGSP